MGVPNAGLKKDNVGELEVDPSWVGSGDSVAKGVGLSKADIETEPVGDGEVLKAVGGALNDGGIVLVSAATDPETLLLPLREPSPPPVALGDCGKVKSGSKDGGREEETEPVYGVV